MRGLLKAMGVADDLPFRMSPFPSPGHIKALESVGGSFHKPPSPDSLTVIHEINRRGLLNTDTRPAGHHYGDDERSLRKLFFLLAALGVLGGAGGYVAMNQMAKTPLPEPEEPFDLESIIDGIQQPMPSSQRDPLDRRAPVGMPGPREVPRQEYTTPDFKRR